ncbi:hypothetical protein GS495_18130 [Rhodococcus hoagii]|nr:hypothetical protein [Prescottella equi]
MREHHAELGDAVRAVLGTRRRTDSRPVDEVDLSLWNDLEQLGFTSLTVPPELGGSGGDLLDAAVILRESATAAVPLAEALFLAGPLLAAAGLPLPRGPITAAAAENVELGRDGDGWHLSGAVRAVPWIPGADHVVLLVRRGGRGAVALVPTGKPGSRWSRAATSPGNRAGPSCWNGSGSPQSKIWGRPTGSGGSRCSAPPRGPPRWPALPARSSPRPVNTYTCDTSSVGRWLPSRPSSTSWRVWPRMS